VSRVIVAIACIVFGLATLKEGGSILFDLGDARHEAGHYVFFVVLVNWLLGFFYVASGVGFLLRRRWSVVMAWAIAAISAITFVAFGVHVALGGAFELRTVLALTSRTLFWAVVALRSPKFRAVS
jgi:hypothetical protein